MASQERRQYIRHSVWVDAVIIAADAPNMSYPAILNEVSIGGCRIQSPKDIKPGTKIAIFLQLDKEIMLRGEIVWVRDEHVAGKNAYQMGVKMSRRKGFYQSESTWEKEAEIFVRNLLDRINTAKKFKESS